MDFIVGTFKPPGLFTLSFTPPSQSNPKARLNIVKDTPAIGGHSWLALSRPGPRARDAPHMPYGAVKDKNLRFLYATTWSQPPSIAAYRVRNSGRDIQFLNAKHVRNLPGYVCVSKTHIYSVGGATGEVFTIAADGGIGELVQELSFVGGEAPGTNLAGTGVPHGDFGGLRHGSHSVDLSPDGRSLYVADIGRNAIFTYSIHNPQKIAKDDGQPDHLKLGMKLVASRANDGPRHTWPHPNGKVLYSLQEHSSMADVYRIDEDGVTLTHQQGVKIIPAEKDPKEYWADEVRLSTTELGSGEAPKYMYASTRGLHKDTMGYVAVFRLKPDAYLESSDKEVDVINAASKPIHIWQTPTSGGLANAIEPAPWSKDFGGVEYLALTDSEEGWVFMLSFDGEEIREVARVSLGKDEEGNVMQAATAIWL